MQINNVNKCFHIIVKIRKKIIIYPFFKYLFLNQNKEKKPVGQKNYKNLSKEII